MGLTSNGQPFRPLGYSDGRDPARWAGLFERMALQAERQNGPTGQNTADETHSSGAYRSTTASRVRRYIRLNSHHSGDRAFSAKSCVPDVASDSVITPIFGRLRFKDFVFSRYQAGAWERENTRKSGLVFTENECLNISPHCAGFQLDVFPVLGNR